MFCVRCGQEAKDLRDGVCGACFLANTILLKVPSIVRVEVCASCGARHKGGSWGDPLPGLAPAIEEEVKAHLELHPTVDRWRMRLEGGEHDPTNHEYEAVVSGRARGLDFEARGKLTLHVQRSTCTRCGRRSGGYYEAILQLRAEDRAIAEDERDRAGSLIESQLGALRSGGDLDSFLVRAEEVKGGWDFYLGTVHAGRVLARALADQMGASIKETASLVGRDKTGIDLYRVTFSVKLPRTRIGGFVALGDTLHMVTGVTPRTVTVVDLDTHRKATRTRAELERAIVLEPRAAREVVVVSESDGELQLLHPESLKTVDLLRPPGFPRGRDAVRAVAWAERLWLLPDAPGDGR